MVSGFLFVSEMLNIYSQCAMWFIVFIIASPGASSAHLTISEIFPSEIRSKFCLRFYVNNALMV